MTPSQALLRLLAVRDAVLNGRNPGQALDLAAACNAYDEAVYAMGRRAQLVLPAVENLKSPSERHAGN